MGLLYSTIRYALRGLLHRPGFSTLVILTVGLGIGLATAAYSVMDALLLRPFPYQDPQRLVRLDSHPAANPGSARGTSLEDLKDWARGQRSMTGLAAYIQFDNNLTDGGSTRAVKMTFANASLFPLLGIEPFLGRTYTEAEDREGGAVRQLVLSHWLWQDQFGGDPGVLGRTVRLRGDTYTVIGVMPPDFRYPDRSDVWVPLMARYASYSFPFWRPRDARLHQVLGRLKPGVTLEQARGDLARVSAELARAYPDTNRDITAAVIPLREAEAGNLRPYVLLLMGGALCVLLIAVLNVSSLLLARSTTRQREMAIHGALGAGVSRVAARLLTESVLLGLAGGVFGAGIAWAAVRVLPLWLPRDLPAWIRFELDWSVLLFCVCASLAAGILFGLAPALRLARVDLASGLKSGTRGAGAARITPLAVLVAAEVGFCLLLLVGAGLLLRSFVHLRQQDSGLQAQHVLAVRTSRFISGKPLAELAYLHGADHREYERRFASLPGVRAAGGSYYVPMEQQARERARALLYVKGGNQDEREQQFPAVGTDVTPGFFDALRIPLLEGRGFTEADGPQTVKVAIVSRSAAEMLWPGRSATGQQLRWGKQSGSNDWLTVIGVAADTRWSSFESGRNLEIYTAARQWGPLAMTFFLRTDRKPESLLPEVRRVVQEVSPDAAVVYARPYPEIVEESLWQPRVWSAVLTGFAGFAAALAGVGLFGVLHYLVSQRTREIGIRLAIGARQADVLRMVVGHGMKWAALGGAAGLAVAAAGSRMLQPMLHGVSVHDPATYLTVSVAVLLVAGTSALLPAWRASRVDPNITLRGD